MTTRSDEALVEEARRGSREAFDELVRRFRDQMIAIAREAIGSREAAEDVVQDAFLQALRALPQLRDPTRFGHWLAVITRCRARRVGARDRRWEPIDPGALDGLLALGHDSPLHPADEYARSSGRTAIHAALARLPLDLRRVLWLYYYEEWPLRRIAAHLSIPVSTVKWRLHHGRQLLRRQLAREWGAQGVSHLQRACWSGDPRGRWKRRPGSCLRRGALRLRTRLQAGLLEAKPSGYTEDNPAKAGSLVGRSGWSSAGRGARRWISTR